MILSGTGSDGTLGICEIKAAGGLTFAQDEHSAQHTGMPQSAITSGAVDLVLPPAEIAGRLATVRQHPYLAPGEDTEPEERGEHPEEFQRIITALRNSSGVDFSQYRDTTLKRRTARRMMLRGFTSAREYAQFLECDRDEAEALYRDVLINVTSFFRDPDMFEDLKWEVFPVIVDGKPGGPPVRLWVPGCSTGQEAYSIAMALLEFLDTAKTTRAIQIFGTDLGDSSFLDAHPDDFAPGRDRDAQWRRGPPDAGPREPPEQCDQVHAQGRAHPVDRRDGRPGGGMSEPGSHSDSRHRGRDLGTHAAEDLRHVHAGRRFHWSGLRRASASA